MQEISDEIGSWIERIPIIFVLKKIYKIKLVFEKLIFYIFFLGFFVFTNAVLAIQHDIEEDLKISRKKDKNIFLIKCKKIRNIESS